MQSIITLLFLKVKYISLHQLFLEYNVNPPLFIVIGKLEKDTGSLPEKQESLRPLRKIESRAAVCRNKLKKVLPQRKSVQRVKRHKDVAKTLSREMKISILRNIHAMGVPGLPDELNEVAERLEELDEKEIDELYISASFGDY